MKKYIKSRKTSYLFYLISFTLCCCGTNSDRNNNYDLNDFASDMDVDAEHDMVDCRLLERFDCDKANMGMYPYYEVSQENCPLQLPKDDDFCAIVGKKCFYGENCARSGPDTEFTASCSSGQKWTTTSVLCLEN